MIVGQDGDGSYSVGERTGLTDGEFVAYLAGIERERQPRWVFPSVDRIYPMLVRAGVRLDRCYDLALAEGLLLAHEGRGAQPKELAGALARAHGRELPHDNAPTHADGQPALFELGGSGLPPGVYVIVAEATVIAERVRRVCQADL